MGGGAVAGRQRGAGIGAARLPVMSSSHVVTGRVQITEIDGIPAEYAPAARRYLGDQAAGAYLAQIGQPGTRMASIDLHPTWVACSTFNPGSRTSLAASHDRRHDPAPRVTVRPAVPSDAQDIGAVSMPPSVRAGPTWATSLRNPCSHRWTGISSWPITCRRMCCSSRSTKPTESSAVQPFTHPMVRCSCCAFIRLRPPSDRPHSLGYCSRGAARNTGR